MTEVAFHFNATDKVKYACRLLRKAAGQGKRVVVTGEAETLGELDNALWTFSATEFIAHCRDDAGEQVVSTSPVVLAQSLRSAPHQEVLVNLGHDIPQGFERFERLIEVVTGDEQDRLGARDRWRHYSDRGYNIQRHDLHLKGPG